MFAGLPGSKQKIGQSFPRGTTMLFWQASAPIGWTKLTTQNDALLRVVNGTGGPLGGGGSNGFSTVNAQTVVGNTTLSATQIPQIDSYYGNYYWPISAGTGSYEPAPSSGGNYVPYYSGGWSYIYYLYSYNTGGSSHNHTVTMNIAYIDLILASKN